MKLREGPRGRRGPKAGELLTTEFPSVDFDLIRDIPAKRWQEAREAIERFAQDPENWSSYGQLACYLALFDPELMRAIQSSDQFRQAAELLVKKRWQQALRGEYVTRLSDVVSIEPFLTPFPEFRKFFSPTTREWKSLLEEIEGQDLHRVLNMYSPVHVFFSLTRLFPNHQGEIREILQLDRVKGESFDLAEDVERGAEDRLFDLAFLRLFYPEEAGRIQRLAKEAKSKLSKEYFNDHVSMNGFLILSLTILFADEARLQPDGSIFIQSKRGSLGSVPKLPDRLVA